MKQSPTMSQIEHAIVTQQYGAQAKPILIEDKSIEGLIRANCPKKERSSMFAYRIIQQLIP